MKKLSYLLLVSLAALILDSCGGSTQSYMNVIPDDAAGVVSLNVGSMINKSGFYDQKSLQGLLLESIEMESSRAVYALSDKILSNVNSSGVDFSQPIFLVLSETFEDNFAIVAKLGKTKDFEDLLAVLEDEDIASNIYRDFEDYNYVILGDDDFVLAYNDASIVVTSIPWSLSADVLVDDGYVGELMSQGASQSIVQNRGFNEMLSQRADMGYYVDYEVLAEEYDMSDYFNMLGVGTMDDLDDVYAYGGVSFEKGLVALNAKLYSDNKEFNEIINKFSKVYSPINNKFLSRVEEDVPFVATVGVNGKQLNSIVMEVLEATPQTAQVVKQYGEQVEQILTLFDGDITVAMTESQDVIAYMAASSRKNAIAAIQTIEDNLGMRFDEVSDGNYRMSLGRRNSLYFGVDGSTLYCTTSSAASRAIGDKVSRAASSLDFLTSTSDKIIFVYGNPNSAVEIFGLERAIRDVPISKYMLDDISHVESSVNEDLLFEAKVVLNDKRENSLKLFMDSLSKVVRSMLR